MQSSWAESRADITEHDDFVIRGAVQCMPTVHPLFVDGETPMDLIGERCSTELIMLNELLVKLGGTPLFTITRDQTIRMLRFRSSSVWACLSDEQKSEMFEQAASRLNVEKWDVDAANFYQGVIRANDFYGTYATEGARRDELLYINACTLFDKPGMYDTPASLFFCSFVFDQANRKPLSAWQKNARSMAWQPDKPYITFTEVAFLYQAMTLENSSAALDN